MGTAQLQMPFNTRIRIPSGFELVEYADATGGMACGYRLTAYTSSDGWTDVICESGSQRLSINPGERLVSLKIRAHSPDTTPRTVSAHCTTGLINVHGTIQVLLENGCYLPVKIASD